MEGILCQAAGPLAGDDAPSTVLVARMLVGAADELLVTLADTPANRAMFGSTRTADDSSPFRQLRIVALTARAGRPLQRDRGPSNRATPPPRHAGLSHTRTPFRNGPRSSNPQRMPA